MFFFGKRCTKLFSLELYNVIGRNLMIFYAKTFDNLRFISFTTQICPKLEFLSLGLQFVRR